MQPRIDVLSGRVDGDRRLRKLLAIVTQHAPHLAAVQRAFRLVASITLTDDTAVINMHSSMKG